jgi:hypothetical protein
MKAKTIILTTIVLSLLMSGCGGSDAEATPTLSVEAIQTYAVAVFSGGLTQTALAAPTNTPTPPSTATPLLPLATPANLQPFVTITSVKPTSSCYMLTYLNDVTIPDNTPMKPGQTFTKTWKVKNSGSCAWDAGFKFAFTGGDAMSGATYTLPQSVPVNTEVDISVAMIAPSGAGTIRGNWRMSTAGGQFFGDEVYLVILAGGTAGSAGTATNTSEPGVETDTPEPTETPTETPIP